MGGGGGAWKVAYADFVTAMMAFFMVMWLTSQSQSVKSAVAEHFRNPGGKRLTGTDSRSLIRSQNSNNGPKKAIKSRGAKRNDGEARHKEMADEGDRSNIGKIVRSDLNSTELNEKGKEEVLDLLPELDGKQFKIEVRGHAANSGGATGQSSVDAMAISFRRAMSVRQFLIDNGIDARRIRVSTAGNAEPRYKEGQVDESLDSRVEVFVLTEMFEEPSSISERLNANKGLDEEAKQLDEQDKSKTSEAPAKGGH